MAATSRERQAVRTKKRLPCTLVVEDSRLAGIVLDLSANGLFVQTSANPSPGTRLDLEIEIPGEARRALLTVRVARRKVVPPRLKSVVHAGLGLQIENAPEAFFRYLAQLQADEAAGAGPPAKTSAAQSPAKTSAAQSPAKTSAAPRSGAPRNTAPRRPPPAPRQERFRVRVSQIGGSRSRSLEIRAASEEEACREAMSTSGKGWRILACERLG